MEDSIDWSAEPKQQKWRLGSSGLGGGLCEIANGGPGFMKSVMEHSCKASAVNRVCLLWGACSDSVCPFRSWGFRGPNTEILLVF